MALEPLCCHQVRGTKALLWVNECCQEDRVPSCHPPFKVYSVFLGGADHQHFSPLPQFCAAKLAEKTRAHLSDPQLCLYNKMMWATAHTCCQVQRVAQIFCPGKEAGHKTESSGAGPDIMWEREWGRPSLRVFLKTVEAPVIKRSLVTHEDKVTTDQLA